MSIVAAYMVPHPPMIIPQIGGGREKQIQQTIDAYRNAAREIASLKPETNEGLLAFVVVDPARRGQGHGKAMLQLALDYAFRISKADAVRLSVFGGNEAWAS